MRELELCIAGGGIAIFPTDTVYGLCCDPQNEDTVRRLHELKGRPAAAPKPAAIMYFALDEALGALPEIGSRTRLLLGEILPGPVTVLLANPRRRFPLAGGEALGLRVPRASIELAGPVLQSSANLAGGPAPRRLRDVTPQIRAGADLEVDGGELPGLASTVLDLRDYERTGESRVIRQGAFTLARARS